MTSMGDMFPAMTQILGARGAGRGRGRGEGAADPQRGVTALANSLKPRGKRAADEATATLGAAALPCAPLRAARGPVSGWLTPLFPFSAPLRPPSPLV